jgi:hypothetical protein
MSARGLIKRQAIGRSGSIGSLYNIRTDQFEPGNLFNVGLPQSFIKTTDCANVSYSHDSHNSQKETLNNLNIETYLKISLMAGLFSLEGPAKYLNQTKTDSKTVRKTFIYKAETKQEDLLVSSKNLREYFSPDAFTNPDATHAVIGIIWGVNVAATFERRVEKKEDVTRIEGTLEANYNKLRSFDAEAKAKNDDQERQNMESLKISFSGDVMIEDCPQTIDQVFEVYRQVPSLIKNLNDGKGKPMTFILCSLEQIAEMTNFERRITRSVFKDNFSIQNFFLIRLVKEVSEDMVNRIEDIFEQMNEERRKLNDFLHDIEPWQNFIPDHWFNSIRQKLTNFDVEASKLKCQLSTLLIGIRSGLTEESQMFKLIDDFDKHPCSSISIKKFFKDNERIKMKRKTLERISPEKKELITDISSIEDFLEDFYHDDVYLLHICEQWEQEDAANSVKQRRFFIKLKQNPKNDRTKYWIIDYDLHSHLQNKPRNSVIYYATNAEIKSRDFREDSLRKLNFDRKFTCY